MNQIKMGKFISELRKEKELTQKDIGDKLGITDNSISKWERGINAPDIYYLGPLSEILGVTIKELLNGERKRKKKVKKENQKPVLEIQNVSKKFGSKEIIHNLSLTIYKGEIVGLIGPNGAGKTTLIKTILGLYKASNGTISICNLDIKKEFEKAMEKVASVVESPDLYEYLTAYQNVRITCLLNGITDMKYAKNILKMVKLNNRLQDKVKHYSLGMKQRLALALALIKKPELLILDEPTNGLDPLGMKELREVILKTCEAMGVSVLISSHILSEIEMVCNKIMILDNGYLIDTFELDEIESREHSLEEEFLKIMSETKNQIGGDL